MYSDGKTTDLINGSKSLSYTYISGDRALDESVKDPGRGWSRVMQILRGKLKLISGRGSRGAVCCVWKIAIMCVIVSGDKNVKKS